jgi:type IX secretion system PorP/SprF family membrane protein
VSPKGSLCILCLTFNSKQKRYNIITFKTNKLRMNSVLKITNTLLKIRLLVFFVILNNSNSVAQQDPQFTQYMYNTVNINPAYAGSRGVMSVFGVYRAQWIGLEGAPITAVASFHTPIYNSKIGMGVSMSSDEIGISERKTVATDFSYTIKTSDKFKLSFGIKGSVNILNLDYNKLNKFDLNDPKFQNNINNKFSPNIGAGLYYHSNKLYAGFSVPNILETNYFDDTSMSIAKDALHYYFISGYVIDVSQTLKLKPAILVKYVNGAPLQTDLTTNFMFYEKFVLGGAWRWDAAASALAGFQIDANWFVGYTYDSDTTKLTNYNAGSHEFFLRYEFKGKKEKIISPRFF